MKFLDPMHPFFRPLWRRWLTVLLPAAWTVVELTAGTPLWGMLFGAVAAYAFYGLILTYPKDTPVAPRPDNSAPDA